LIKMCRNRINDIETADTAYLMFLYKKLKMQLIAYSSHIAFLRYCLRNKSKPRFVKCRLYADSSLTAAKLTQRLTTKWINCELHRWYGKKNVNSRLVMFAHLRLSTQLAPQDLDTEEECTVY